MHPAFIFLVTTASDGQYEFLIMVTACVCWKHVENDKVHRRALGADSCPLT